MKIDVDLFEHIIALNITGDEIYAAAVFDVLKLEHIKNTDVQRYLTIIRDFYKKRGTLPTATEIKVYLDSDELKTSYKKVLTKFHQLSTNYNPEELLQNTESYIRERAIAEAMLDTLQSKDKGGELDPGKLLEKFESACNLSLVDDLGHDYFYQIDKHIKDLQETSKYISTGYKWLDKMLGGGFLETGRALYVFSGATNSGKSIVLGNLAANVADQGRCVVVISLEMPETVYAKRISSQITRIPIAKLKEESDQLRKQLYEYKEKNPNARLFIKEYPPKGVTPSHIKAYIKKLMIKERVKVDLVIIDYLNLLKPATDQGSLYANVKSIAEDVRALSYPLNFGCSVVSATQLNRAGVDAVNPGLETTSESMGLAHTVDFMGSLWSSEAERELGIINIGLQKSRFGPNFGKQAFRIDYDTLAIDETDDVFSESTEQTQQISNTLNILGEK
jgi:replicative DNA helicase